MVHKTIRLPEKEVLRIQRATGRPYQHNATKADPSIVILTDATVITMLHDMLTIIERLDKMRWV